MADPALTEYDVFIAYSREGSEFARELTERLRAAKFSVYFAENILRPGTPYDTNLEAAVKACGLFLFVISADSVEHGSYALTELEWAVAADRKLLHVRAEGHENVPAPAELAAHSYVSTRGDIKAKVVVAVRDLLDPTRRSPSPRRRRSAGTAAVLAAAAVAVAVAVWWRQTAPPPSVTFTRPMPGDQIIREREFKVEGRTSNVPAGLDLWVVHRRDRYGRGWPREDFVSRTKEGNFTHVVFDHGDPGELFVCLMAVPPEITRVFQSWLKNGKLTGAYHALDVNLPSIDELGCVEVHMVASFAATGAEAVKTAEHTSPIKLASLTGPPTPQAAIDMGKAITLPASPVDWSKSIFTATGARVRRGQLLVIEASGRWNVGLGYVDADGRADRCKCPVRDANDHAQLGALIGRIGERGRPFLVGKSFRGEARESGELYLGSNDNLDDCIGSGEGSCYADNRGELEVHVRVR